MSTVDTGSSKERRYVTLPARPEPLRLAVEETAVVVVDMQNAYASPNGYLDIAGFDISGAKAAMEAIRERSMWPAKPAFTVVYFQNGWDKDYVEAGTPQSPNWHKSNALKTMRKRPELQGNCSARQGWMGLRAGRRTEAAAWRHSLFRRRATADFFNSQFDSIPCARAASATWCSAGSPPTSASSRRFRDGFHLEYFGVMLEDATTRPARSFFRRRPSSTWKHSSAGLQHGRLPEGLRSNGKCLPTSEEKMTDRAIIPTGTQPPLAPYSPGIMADNTIYVSGTLAFDKNNDVVHVGDAAAQTRHIPRDDQERAGNGRVEPRRRDVSTTSSSPTGARD